MTDKKESVLEDTKEQTAMQQLIGILERKKRTSVSSHLGCLDMCIRECQGLLDLEAKQIEDAFEDGADDVFYAINKFEDGKQFYKETYEQ